MEPLGDSMGLPWKPMGAPRGLMGPTGPKTMIFLTLFKVVADKYRCPFGFAKDWRETRILRFLGAQGPLLVLSTTLHQIHCSPKEKDSCRAEQTLVS